MDCSNVLDSDTFQTTNEEIADYVGQSFKYGGEMRRAVETFTTPVLQQPTKPPVEATKTEILIWEIECEAYLEGKTIMIKNIEALCMLVWGQCTYGLRLKLEDLEEFMDITSKSDGIALLKAIKNAAYNYQSHRYLPLVMLELMQRFFSARRGRRMTNEKALKKFQQNVAMIEHNGGAVGVAPGPKNQLQKRQATTRVSSMSSRSKMWQKR